MTNFPVMMSKITPYIKKDLEAKMLRLASGLWTVSGSSGPLAMGGTDL